MLLHTFRNRHNLLPVKHFAGTTGLLGGARIRKNVSKQPSGLTGRPEISRRKCEKHSVSSLIFSAPPKNHPAGKDKNSLGGREKPARNHHLRRLCDSWKETQAILYCGQPYLPHNIDRVEPDASTNTPTFSTVRAVGRRSHAPLPQRSFAGLFRKRQIPRRQRRRHGLQSV